MLAPDVSSRRSALRGRRGSESSRSSPGSSCGPCRTPRRFLAGLFDYRGDVVPVVDLGVLLGGETCRERLEHPDQSSSVDAGGRSGWLGLVAEPGQRRPRLWTSAAEGRRPGRSPGRGATPYLGRPSSRSSDGLSCISIEPVRSPRGRGSRIGRSSPEVGCAMSPPGWPIDDAPGRPARARPVAIVGEGLIHRRRPGPDGGARAPRPIRVRTRAWSGRTRAAGADRGGGHPRELVLPRRPALRGVPRPCPIGLAGPAPAGRRCGPEHPLRRGRGALLDRRSRCSKLGLPPDRFRVDAVGRQRPAAGPGDRRGLSGRTAFRGIDRTSIARATSASSPTASTLDPSVRSTRPVPPGQHARSRPARRRPPYDVIFCRNLLIYLDGPARAVAACLARSAAGRRRAALPGHADPLDDSPASPFRPIAEKGSFAHRKGPANEPDGPAEGDHLPAVPATKPLRRPTAPVPASVGRARTLIQSSRREEPKPRLVPPGRMRPIRGPTLEVALKLADQGRYDEASDVVERAILETGPSARAFALLGMIRQAAGDRDRAEASFLKAVYLDAQDDESLLALALLARRRGDVAAESVYRRRLDRVRSRKEKT